jgi:hypothetical protein
LSTLIQYAILVLATARLTLLITRDDIFEPFRQWFFMISPPENDERAGYWFQNYERIGFMDYAWTNGEARSAGFWGRVVSCPDCSSVWLSALVCGSYGLFGPITTTLLAPLAVAMVVSLVARRY